MYMNGTKVSRLEKIPPGFIKSRYGGEGLIRNYEVHDRV